jgi:HD-like signal output (HDOD) protein
MLGFNHGVRLQQPAAGKISMHHQTEQRKVEAMERMIRQIDRLHSGPGVARKMLTLIRNPEFNLAEVGECLEHDPALSARILGVVNSSRYGLVRKIGSVRHAAAFLGRRSLQLVTLSFSLIDSFSRGPYRQMYVDYWKKALTIATVAQRIARRAGGMCADEAYTAGLVADIGVLALAQVAGEEYVRLYLQHPHGAELVAVETATFGFNHAEFGSRLLDQWSLPDAVTAAVAGHHASTPGSEPIEAVVHAGWLMSEALWIPNSPRVAAARQFLQTECGFDLDDFIELAHGCRNDIHDSAEAFGIALGSAINCHQLIDEARRVSLETALAATFAVDQLELADESPVASRS